MDPPPLSSAPPIAASSPPAPPQTASAAAGIHSYPDSIDSSPRSRNTDSWDEPPYGPAAAPHPPAGGGKLRLMCSYGGHIVPRPHDKSLCYVGGETRIIVSDRNTTLSDLVHRLSKTLLDGKPFALKYQLPNEDLDSLITVTTDEDFENMVDEYDRLSKTPSSRTSRLRLFLFPAKSGSETSSSIESLLENSSKSNEWFFNALNSTSPGKNHRAISETSSVNCLLGLDDQSPPVPKGPSEAQSDKANANVTHQDVHSVPDSPMLETTSSFGSTSSSPSTANKVGSEEGKGGIEEVQALQQQVQAPQPAQSQPIKPVAAFDLASPDSVSSDGSGRNPLSRQKPMVFVEPVAPPLQSVNAQLAATHIDPKAAELTNRVQMAQQVQENAFVLPSQFDQYQQMQYVPTGAQMMQHHHNHHPSGAVPMYYSVFPSQQLGHHQAQTMEQQHQYQPVYLMPTRPQAYNFPVQQQPAFSESMPATPSTRLQTSPNATLVPPTAFTPASNAAATVAKPEVAAAAMYKTTAATPQHLVQVPSNQPSPQYAGYSQFPHPSHTIAPSSVTTSYAYEYSEPTHTQIYYTQPLAPQLTTQYQTMTSTAPLKLPEISAPHPSENIKLQVRTTQP